MNLTNGSRSCNSFAFYLDTYYQLFIIIIGLMGNSMTIIIFWRTKLAHSKKTSFYLISLAVSDIAFLITLLINFIDAFTLIKLTSKYSYFCKFITFIGFTIAFLSVGLVLAFTVQRLCSICFPLSVNKFNLERRSKAIVVSLIIIGCLIYAYNLTIYDVEIENEETICRAKSGFENQAERFFFFDSLLTLIIPFFGLLVMNAMIIRTLKHSNYNFIIRTSNHSTRRSKNDKNQSSNSAINPNLVLPNGSNLTIGSKKETEKDSKKLNGRSSLRSIKRKNKNNETDRNRNQKIFEDENTNKIENVKTKQRNSLVCYQTTKNIIHKDSIAQTNIVKIKYEENPTLIKPGSTFKFKRFKKENILPNSKNKKERNLVNYGINNQKHNQINISDGIHNHNNNNNNNIKNQVIFENNDGFGLRNDSINNFNELKDIKSQNFEMKCMEKKKKIMFNRHSFNSYDNCVKKSNYKFNYSISFKDEYNQKTSIKSHCKLNSLNNQSPTRLKENKTKRNSLNIDSNGSQNRMSFRIAGPRTNSVSRKITKMLIIVSSTFLVLNLPIHTFNIYIYVSRSYEEHSEKDIEWSNSTIISNSMGYTCKESNIRSIVNNIFYTSFSCNFLLYSISGVTFRNECKRLRFKLLRVKTNK